MLLQKEIILYKKDFVGGDNNSTWKTLLEMTTFVNGFDKIEDVEFIHINVNSVEFFNFQR